MNRSDKTISNDDAEDACAQSAGASGLLHGWQMAAAGHIPYESEWGQSLVEARDTDSEAS